MQPFCEPSRWAGLQGGTHNEQTLSGTIRGRSNSGSDSSGIRARADAGRGQPLRGASRGTERRINGRGPEFGRPEPVRKHSHARRQPGQGSGVVANTRAPRQIAANLCFLAPLRRGFLSENLKGAACSSIRVSEGLSLRPSDQTSRIRLPRAPLARPPTQPSFSPPITA